MNWFGWFFDILQLGWAFSNKILEIFPVMMREQKSNNNLLYCCCWLYLSNNFSPSMEKLLLLVHYGNCLKTTGANSG